MGTLAWGGGLIGWPEILLILVVALLLFGGKRLPEFGRSLGRSFREFKDGLKGVKKEMDRAGGDEASTDGTPDQDAKGDLETRAEAAPRPEDDDTPIDKAPI